MDETLYHCFSISYLDILVLAILDAKNLSTFQKSWVGTKRHYTNYFKGYRIKKDVFAAFDELEAKFSNKLIPNLLYN